MIAHRILPLAGIAAVIAAVAVSATVSHGGVTPPPAAAAPVRVATVHLQPAAQAERYAAVIQPRIEASVGFRVGGKLAQRLVEVGDRVDAGTVLARLDAADLALQRESAEAQLASAAADAANAEHDFARYASLRQGQWTTQQEYDKRKAATATAAARARQETAELQLARDNLGYATLTADGPGVITQILAEPGQVVAQGQAVFRIARLGEMEAVADVPEQAMAALSGAQLDIELWSLPGVTLKGRLREMAPSADAGTRTYRARITLENPPAAVQLGMTATLVARQAASGSVAVLPATALASRGAEPAVFVVNAAGDGLELKPVGVAAYAGDQVVLSGGVADGDRVVTSGVQKLDTGQRVRIWTEPVR
jgi:RND family efflux transporter MFP subunit